MTGIKAENLLKSGVFVKRSSFKDFFIMRMKYQPLLTPEQTLFFQVNSVKADDIIVAVIKNGNVNYHIQPYRLTQEDKRATDWEIVEI